jgi:hypothetical protein
MARSTRSSLPTATWTKRGDAWVNKVAGIVTVGDKISSQARGKAVERRVVTKVLETTADETIVVSELDKAKAKTTSAPAPNTTKAASRVDVLTAGVCEGESIASKTPGRASAPPREWLDKIGFRWVSKHHDPALNGKLLEIVGVELRFTTSAHDEDALGMPGKPTGWWAIRYVREVAEAADVEVPSTEVDYHEGVHADVGG